MMKDEMNLIPNQYGDVWSQPAINLNSIKNESESDLDAFKKALSMGYFSQYTSYRQRDLVERLIDWQISILNKWLGDNLINLPAELEELEIIPEVLNVNRCGRNLSPDLLRNLWYMLYIRSQKSMIEQPNIKNIIEIGSGYGSFARIAKVFYPEATIWLVDLPESLIYAKTYLKSAYPESTLAVIDSQSVDMSALEQHNFVLVPVEQSNKLVGNHFDLAVNIWSFGEMPNRWIKHWFDLIQSKSTVDRLYLLNAFSSPITTQTKERANQGNWLSQLNENWVVEDFHVDPEIHQCPWVKNFYTGLNIFCRRIDSEEQLLLAKQTAHSQLSDVYLEDWVSISTAGQIVTNLERPETNINNTPGIANDLSNQVIAISKLLSVTEYIGHPRFDTSYSGTFYRLWNDFRLNATPSSGGLLICYLGMVFKTELNNRCTKEEIFFLNKLPVCNLYEEYSALRENSPRDLHVEYNGTAYTIQEACDLAESRYQYGDIETSSQLLSRVAVAVPQHGHCWYQLSRLIEYGDDLTLAVVAANHANRLAVDNYLYHERTELLLQTYRYKHRFVWYFYSFSAKLTDKIRDKFIAIASKIFLRPTSIICKSIILAGIVHGDDSRKYVLKFREAFVEKTSNNNIKEAFRTI